MSKQETGNKLNGRDLIKRRFIDFLKPYTTSYIGSVLLAIASVFWSLAPYYIL